MGSHCHSFEDAFSFQEGISVFLQDNPSQPVFMSSHITSLLLALSHLEHRILMIQWYVIDARR